MTSEQARTVMYTLISHGPDGRGGYTNEGVLHRPCIRVRQDGENCEFTRGGTADSVFTYTLLNSDANTRNHFDDIVDFTVKERIEIPTISAFNMEIMPCNAAGAAHTTKYSFGQKCATGHYTLNQIRLNPNDGDATNDVPRDAGAQIYTKQFIGISDGFVYIRATIPVRFRRHKWDPPVIAAIYLDGVLLEASELINPAEHIAASTGGTGVILAKGQVTEGSTHTVEIYVYHSCALNCGTGEVTIGTIRHADHFVDGVVEITQTGAS